MDIYLNKQNTIEIKQLLESILDMQKRKKGYKIKEKIIYKSILLT